MSRTTYAWLIGALLALAIAVTASMTAQPRVAFAGEDPTEVPADTPVPTDTPAPTDTPVPPTDTPQPTNTTAPTDTPEPTDTPVPTETEEEGTETPDAAAIATQTAEAENDDDDGGGSSSDWLLWALLIIGAIAVVGAIAGFIISRNRSAEAAAAEAEADERELWAQDARMTYGKASSLHGDLRAGISPAPGAAAMSDDLEWLNRQNSRLDEVGFELGRLATGATSMRDRTAAESLAKAVGEMRGVIQQRLSPTGFATPADYQQTLQRELFELDAAVRAFQTTL